MKADELRHVLAEKAIQFDEQSIEHGVQFRCVDGEIFNVYNTGKVICQGQKSDLSESDRMTSGCARRSRRRTWRSAPCPAPTRRDGADREAAAIRTRPRRRAASCGVIVRRRAG